MMWCSRGCSVHVTPGELHATLIFFGLIVLCGFIAGVMAVFKSTSKGERRGKLVELGRLIMAGTFTVSLIAWLLK